MPDQRAFFVLTQAIRNGSAHLRYSAGHTAGHTGLTGLITHGVSDTNGIPWAVLRGT